jgi:hypothetical protein
MQHKPALQPQRRKPSKPSPNVRKNQRYAATKVGRRRAVQSLIRAEGVLGKFELAETPFFSRLKKTNPSRRKKVAEVS